ncbi:MAG: MarR family transcriptional regulator [Desulfohalobiaceae bacterium]|nr:MarR family transcriptional regulator [Desulfohalobiaceae bacterium]
MANQSAHVHFPPIEEFQTLKLKELIYEIVKCCEDRRIYENQKFGIPYAAVQCLLLFRDERYLTVKTIALRLEVAKSRVTKLINGLIDKNLVKRIDDPQDSRVKLISLTPEGREKVREIETFHFELHNKLLKRIHPHEREGLLACLENLKYYMDAVKQELIEG